MQKMSLFHVKFTLIFVVWKGRKSEKSAKAADLKSGEILEYKI